MVSSRQPTLNNQRCPAGRAPPQPGRAPLRRLRVAWPRLASRPRPNLNNHWPQRRPRAGASHEYLLTELEIMRPGRDPAKGGIRVSWACDTDDIRQTTGMTVQPGYCGGCGAAHQNTCNWQAGTAWQCPMHRTTIPWIPTLRVQ